MDIFSELASSARRSIVRETGDILGMKAYTLGIDNPATPMHLRQEEVGLGKRYD